VTGGLTLSPCVFVTMQGDALDMLEDVNTGIAWVMRRVSRRAALGPVSVAVQYSRMHLTLIPSARHVCSAHGTAGTQTTLSS
jgi:hypothetical protein